MAIRVGCGCGAITMNNINITSVQYVQSEFDTSPTSVKAVIEGSTVFVPLDPANRHYAEIMRQVEAGTLTIADAE